MTEQDRCIVFFEVLAVAKAIDWRSLKRVEGINACLEGTVWTLLPESSITSKSEGGESESKGPWRTEFTHLLPDPGLLGYFDCDEVGEVTNLVSEGRTDCPAWEYEGTTFLEVA
jgi:hypothetical protein